MWAVGSHGKLASRGETLVKASFRGHEGSRVRLGAPHLPPGVVAVAAAVFRSHCCVLTLGSAQHGCHHSLPQPYCPISQQRTLMQGSQAVLNRALGVLGTPQARVRL